MIIRLKIFNHLPDFLKIWATFIYIAIRKVRESVYALVYARNADNASNAIRVVYLTGFPRSGTTVLKYYFSSYPSLKMALFDPAGFFVSWSQSLRQPGKDIIVDKSNHYIQSPELIFKGCGAQAALCCLVRDPRDSLLSLLSFPEAREVPRGAAFWPYWYQTYSHFLDFAEHTPLGNRIFFLRFEDFAIHPCAAKSDYLSWLGIDTNIAPIDSSYPLPEEREFVLDKVHKWKTISSEPVQSWRNKLLSTEEAKLLSGWRDYPPAQKLMEKLGYLDEELQPPTLKAFNFRMFQAPGTENLAATRPRQ